MDSRRSTVERSQLSAWSAGRPRPATAAAQCGAGEVKSAWPGRGGAWIERAGDASVLPDELARSGAHRAQIVGSR